MDKTALWNYLLRGTYWIASVADRSYNFLFYSASVKRIIFLKKNFIRKEKGQTLVCPLHFDSIPPAYLDHIRAHPTDAQAQPAHAPAPSADTAR